MGGNTVLGASRGIWYDSFSTRSLSYTRELPFPPSGSRDLIKIKVFSELQPEPVHFLQGSNTDSEGIGRQVIEPWKERHTLRSLLFKGTNFCVFCDLEKSAKFKDPQNLRCMRKWRSVIFHAHAQSALVRKWYAQRV